MSTIPTADLEADLSRSQATKVAFLVPEDGASIALVLLLLVEHLSFGGNRTNVSLCFALVQTLILAYVLSTHWGRKGLQRLEGWITAAGLFALTLMALLSSLLPLPIGGNPAWLHVGGREIAAINPSGVWIEVSKLLGMASVFTLGAVLSAERRRGAMLMKALIIAALGFGLVCLVLEGLSPKEVFGWPKPIISQYRVSGLFSSANTAATLFGVNALLAAGGLMRGADQLPQKTPFGALIGLVNFFPVELVAFFISAGCLLLTASRGGIGAFALSFAVLLAWRSSAEQTGASKVSKRLLGGIAVGLVLVSGAFAVDRYFHAAFFDDARPAWADLTWRLFRAAPLRGFGPGSLALMFQSLTSPATFGIVSWAGSAHNVYLQWLAEAGILGCIPMGALMVWLIFRSLQKIPHYGGAAVWRPTVFACVLLILIHSMVEYSLQEPSIAATFSLLLGLSLGFASQRRTRKRAKPRFARSAQGDPEETASYSGDQDLAKVGWHEA